MRYRFRKPLILPSPAKPDTRHHIPVVSAFFEGELGAQVPVGGEFCFCGKGGHEVGLVHAAGFVETFA